MMVVWLKAVVMTMQAVSADSVVTIYASVMLGLLEMDIGTVQVRIVCLMKKIGIYRLSKYLANFDSFGNIFKRVIYLPEG